MYNSCAFTGHRDLSFGLDYSLLDKVILNLIKIGCKTFYCGMAAGFDLAAAESVIGYKKYYGIKLVACIPCSTQPDGFSKKNNSRYLKILENCDEKIVFSENYFAGCMHVRDRFMVDNCDVVVCFMRKNSGGTYYTVKYAESREKTVVRI